MRQRFCIFLSGALFEMVARYGTNKHALPWSQGLAACPLFLASEPEDPRFCKLETAPEESIFSTSEGSGAEIPSR